MAIAVLNYSNTSAQDIETLVMPGQVIEAHADIESECSSCHKMFDKAAQAQLCTDCHEEIGTDIASSMGFHGLYPEATDCIPRRATTRVQHVIRNTKVAMRLL